jgi:hypothetical protein
LSHSTNPFCEGYFWDRVSWAICPGWLRTMILLTSASWVVRIAGVSHQHPARGTLSSFSSIFKNFLGSGVWTQCLVLARQVLYHLSYKPSPLFFISVLPAPHYQNVNSLRTRTWPVLFTAGLSG